MQRTTHSKVKDKLYVLTIKSNNEIKQYINMNVLLSVVIKYFI